MKRKMKKKRRRQSKKDTRRNMDLIKLGRHKASARSGRRISQGTNGGRESDGGKAFRSAGTRD